MADRVGQHLGNYHLIRLLGRGGFAEVYLGEHLHLLTQAAVKVLHTRLASHDDVEGFEKEARTVAHLKHPHIVHVFDYNVEEETPFLVMEYAPGGTLRTLHPKGTRLPLPTIISYVKQVAAALQYAHDQRLIHRDIKPENLLVGAHNELLLSDFGIATLAHSSHSLDVQQGIGGTLPYMAPEQIQGKPRRESDQYALAVMVYEWIAGQTPFRGTTAEIITQHTMTPPPSLLKLAPAISKDVDLVVRTALEKDPHHRFSSVRAFATALEQACQNTQAAPSLPAVSFSSSALARVPQPSLPVPLLQDPPSQAPAYLSSPPPGPNLTPGSRLWPDEPRTGQHSRPQAKAALGNAPFAEPAPRSSRRMSLLMPSRKMSVTIIIVAGVLLATLLSGWIANQGSAHTPTPKTVPAGVITEFAIPTVDSSPRKITRGPDDNLWFTEQGGNKIGRISTRGVITEFAVPTAGSSPYGITVGPDGNLWFTEENGNKIGRISTSGTITEFAVPTATSDPSAITAGPDGNLWFIEGLVNKIGRISTSGTVTEFAVPQLPANSGLEEITAGPDGHLWFTENADERIGRISTSGTFSKAPFPPYPPASGPSTMRLTVGPDHQLWFTDENSGKIGRISASGTITEFPLPASSKSRPFAITAGPDGHLWFTDYETDQIGRISTSGTITEFPVPTAGSSLFGITAGPDGNLWFTEWRSNRVGRITSGR